MPTLALPWRRDRAASHDAATRDFVVNAVAPKTDTNCLVLLIPTEGGLAFQLLPFSDLESARRHLEAYEPAPPQRFISFWALDPDEKASGLEAVVMVPQPGRPGVVQIFSFVDMTAARAFVEAESKQGLDAGQVLICWAAPARMDKPGHASPPARGRFAAWLAAMPPAVAASPSAMPVTAPMNNTQGLAKPGVETSQPQQDGGSSGAGLISRVTTWEGWDGLAPRVVNAALLKEAVYYDVDEDTDATGRARLIFGLAIMAAAIGALGDGLASAALHIPAALLAFAAYIAATYLISTTVLSGNRRDGSFERTVQALGVASGPALFVALGFVPIYGPLFVLIAYIWIVPTTALAAAASLELDRQSSLIAGSMGALVLFALAQVVPMLLA